MVLLFLALAGMTALFLVNKNGSGKKIADQKAQIESPHLAGRVDRPTRVRRGLGSGVKQVLQRRAAGQRRAPRPGLAERRT